MDGLIKLVILGVVLLVSFGFARMLVCACVETLLARSFSATRARPRLSPAPAGQR